MGMESFTIIKAVSMKDNGKIIKCMEGVSYSIRMVKWPMMENGRKINFMDRGKYIMKNIKICQMEVVITPILSFWIHIGYHMKEILTQIGDMERER